MNITEKKEAFQLESFNGNRQHAIVSSNLGQPTLNMSMPIQPFVDNSDVPNYLGVPSELVAQRPLNIPHATGLATFILKALVKNVRQKVIQSGVDRHTAALQEIVDKLGDSPYMALAPLVVNIPASLDELEPELVFGADGKPVPSLISFQLGRSGQWGVMDGQHRRAAMEKVLMFLQSVKRERKYPRKGSLYPYNGDGPDVSHEQLEVWRMVQNVALNHCVVAVEAHLGLSIDQQRQMFHDLNNRGKKVEAGRAFGYDYSNPVVTYIKDELMKEPGGIFAGKIAPRDVTDWTNHDGSSALKDVVAVNSILFLNRTNPNSATPAKASKMRPTANKFWAAVGGIPGFGEVGAKRKTVAAQSVVLKALAKLVHDLSQGRQADPKLCDRVLRGIGTIDFSHSNTMWQYYKMDREERQSKLAGLEDYLPSESDSNRDIGAYEPRTGHMRFGAKHNDIFPLIGDMIRWKLGLPSRHPATVKEAA